MPDIEITDEIIDKAIDENYAVFLGFSLADGDITFEEYMQKLKEHGELK